MEDKRNLIFPGRFILKNADFSAIFTHNQITYKHACARKRKGSQSTVDKCSGRMKREIFKWSDTTSFLKINSPKSKYRFAAFILHVDLK